MSEWKECKLGDISDVRDGTHDSPKEKPEGRFLITSKHIKNGKIDFSSAYRISEEDFEQINKRSKVDKWDILFSMIGTIAETVIVDFEPDFAIKNVGLFKTGNKDLSKWIYYYLKSTDAKNEIDACLKGSTQQYITLGDLRNFPIKIPPLPEQKAIAEVLTSLDDKIGLLHKQNKTLEQLAETLFRHHFIDNAQDDWEDGTLSDLIIFNPERKLSKGSEANYLEMSNLSDQSSIVKDWRLREYTSGMRFMNEDALLARITPCLENGKTCFVNFLNEGEIGWGSTEFIVMRTKQPYHPFISYLVARNEDFREFAIANMSGSSGRQRVEASRLGQYLFKIPPESQIIELNNELESIAPKLRGNLFHILTLEKLRDQLLPKLMSGEVVIEF